MHILVAAICNILWIWSAFVFTNCFGVQFDLNLFSMPINGGRREQGLELPSSSADRQSRRATSIELRTTFVLDCSSIHPVACDVNRHHIYTRTVALIHALNVDLLSPKNYVLWSAHNTNSPFLIFFCVTRLCVLQAEHFQRACYWFTAKS